MDAQVIFRLPLFLALALAPALAQGPPAQAPAVPKGSAFSAECSRKMLGDAKGEWIAAMRSRLPMAHRATGPFGRPQNLHVKVAAANAPKLTPGAFLAAIKAIKINTVMAAEQKFAVGAREFRAGDRFPVVRGQRQFNIRIVSVRGDHIVFENVDTGEHVRRNLNALPPGVSRSSGIESVPGVVPESKKDNSPLHLDSPTLPTSNTE